MSEKKCAFKEIRNDYFIGNLKSNISTNICVLWNFGYEKTFKPKMTWADFCENFQFSKTMVKIRGSVGAEIST